VSLQFISEINNEINSTRHHGSYFMIKYYYIIKYLFTECNATNLLLYGTTDMRHMGILICNGIAILFLPVEPRT